ncbi:MAG: DUF5615 family PIN-like protein [Planctomycetota bacterium]
MPAAGPTDDLDGRASLAEIAPWLRTTFGIEGRSILDLGFERAPDRVIFDRARLAGASILTKDFDFVQQVHRCGAPPTILWLTIGNTTSAVVQELLRENWLRLRREVLRARPLVELHCRG